MIVILSVGVALFVWKQLCCMPLTADGAYVLCISFGKGFKGTEKKFFLDAWAALQDQYMCRVVVLALGSAYATDTAHAVDFGCCCCDCVALAV
jgi:hypothetical protein